MAGNESPTSSTGIPVPKSAWQSKKVGHAVVGTTGTAVLASQIPTIAAALPPPWSVIASFIIPALPIIASTFSQYLQARIDSQTVKASSFDFSAFEKQILDKIATQAAEAGKADA